MPTVCSTPGCTTIPISRGMCKRHYDAAYFGRGVIPGLLSVECWCRAQIVMVSQPDVMRGRTRTCGQPRCRESSAALD